MFQNVIIATSGGPSTSDAVALAHQLLAPDGRLTLAHVWPSGDRRVPAMRQSRGSRIARADRILADARLITGIDAVAGVGADDVAAGLHDLARRRAADLIVVASPRRPALARLGSAGVAARVLTGAPCPVAVAPAGYRREGAITTIGAGYCDWEAARPLVRMARDLADAHAGGLRLFKSLAAAPTVSYLDTAGLSERVGWIDWDAALELVLLSDNAPLQVGLGDAVAELAQFSATVDLLVVASRCPSWLARLVRPSASVALTRRARCPLLVMPGCSPLPGDDRRGGDPRVAAA